MPLPSPGEPLDEVEKVGIGMREAEEAEETEAEEEEEEEDIDGRDAWF